jgi:2-polyprenyl-3-methyl-5-hydroxy-6-metoxy-1,4-benzoquinol methylase
MHADTGAVLPTACIDVPVDGDLVQRHAFACEGWVVSSARRTVTATIDGVVVGRTQLGFARPDVEAVIDAASGTISGFFFSCEPPERLRARASAELVVTVTDDDGAREVGRRGIRFSDVDYREFGHGGILTEAHPGVLRRADVYGSGPPSPVADPRAIALMQRFLRPADRILDVGCGIGAYGRVLGTLGYDWTGVEVRDDFVDEVRRAGLRAEPYDGKRIPFDEASFDAAICIEVLEHVDDYAPFVAEIARVTRRTAVFSVPNYEAVPVMARAYAIPWHLLESDHKNFFTRRGLKLVLSSAFADVEVFEYGPLENFHTPDGVPVYNHLMAVASR